MYIPTQEERYAKKGLLSLILCVVVPSCLYLSLLSEQLNMVRGHEWEAIMKIFLAFSYPLAALFAMMGVSFFWWAVGLAPKQAICAALCLGMLDFLLVKLFPFPAGIIN